MVWPMFVYEFVWLFTWNNEEFDWVLSFLIFCVLKIDESRARKTATCIKLSELNEYYLWWLFQWKVGWLLKRIFFSFIRIISKCSIGLKDLGKMVDLENVELLGLIGSIGFSPSTCLNLSERTLSMDMTVTNNFDFTSRPYDIRLNRTSLSVPSYKRSIHPYSCR